MSQPKIDRDEFHAQLTQWYRSHNRSLPWRKTRDPYKIWISEIMLQQTTVQTVIPFYERWIKHFPDTVTLSKAPIRRVLKIWEGLGYYQRARNVHQAAKMIVNQHRGRIPQRYDDLIKLPGFGPYTASAVLSIAFNKPYLALDANVRRVGMRLIGLKGKTSSKTDKTVKTFLDPFTLRKKMRTFNQALMELGALVCRPRNPSCLLCPVSEYCRAFENGEQEIIPSPRKRDCKKIDAVIAIIKEEDRYLIQQRPKHGLLAGLWEFPGGKRMPGESLKAALRRELQEELGAEITEIHFFTQVQHAYTHFRVTLYAYSCRLRHTLQLTKHGFRWVTLKEMRQYPFPSGSVKIIKYLERGL